MRIEVIIVFLYALSVQAGEGGILKSSRREMIKQLERYDIRSEPVLKAMSEIPREEFVPKEMRPFAYDDRPLPIGEEQTISQPYIVAFMTEAIADGPLEKVLEIGTGSGYQAAVLSKVFKEVYSIEIIDALAQIAKKKLEGPHYSNVHLKVGDGYFGWKEKGPFDAIIVTAAPDKVPESLIEQLKVGGRMIIPVGTSFQELIRITKTSTGTKKEHLLAVRFVPLTRLPNR